MNATQPGGNHNGRNGPSAGKNNDRPTLAHGRKPLPVKLKVTSDWEDRARQAGYNLDKFAIACGVTKRRLQQFFREQWSFSPELWLRRLRLSDVVRQLPEDCRLKEVFPGFGFTSSADFCQKFRNAFGFTPGRFLRQRRAVKKRISYLAVTISL